MARVSDMTRFYLMKDDSRKLLKKICLDHLFDKILLYRLMCMSRRKMINSSISKPMRGTQLTYTHLWFLDLTQTWIFFYFFCWSLIFLFCHKFYLAKYFHLQICYIFFPSAMRSFFFAFLHIWMFLWNSPRGA